MEMHTHDVRRLFTSLYWDKKFTVDRTGSKTIEILGASFIADDYTIFGELNKEYAYAEVAWYESMSLNINDIYNGQKEPPAAWKMSADKHGNINSNYGNLVFSHLHYDQFEHVRKELDRNPNSRRATMIYTRPSIWVEATENDKSDFICTNAVTYYIRDNKLHTVVQMRSNDAVFGYKNDLYWQKHIRDALLISLDEKYELGNIYWQVQNLHVYERHFPMIENFIETGNYK